MYGYLRPRKSELLVREFQRYQAVYCGLCKEIGRRHGQLPRLGSSYDLNFLAIFAFALTPDNTVLNDEACILNPLRKKTVVTSHPLLSKVADLGLLLNYYKVKDDHQDERSLKSKMLIRLFARKYKQIKARYRDLDLAVAKQMEKIFVLEARSKDHESCLQIAESFGTILSLVFAEVFRENQLLSNQEQAGIKKLAFDLGQWIYYLDAIDDYSQDLKTGRYNPFAQLSRELALEKAAKLCLDLEKEIDLTAALLPYERDAGLISNIICLGLPYTRTLIWQGEVLPKI